MNRLAERYRLEEVIGAGGTATVYRAIDERLGVERAVKLLHLDAGPAMVGRLQTEARILARIEHPNVLRVYDVVHDDGRDFIVMDLVSGGSLQDRLDALGPFPVEVASELMLQVLSALAAAHAAGVIHRDVKPHNVLLAADGRALLADFGIARVAEDARNTRTNVAMGSLAYMAPEQRLDAHAAAVTADVYAAACTLYVLLTGASPMDLFVALRASPRWSEVPGPLQSLLQRGTRHDPAERQPDIPAFAAELREATRTLGLTIPGEPEGDGATDRSGGKRGGSRPSAGPTARLALLVVLLVVGLWTAMPGESPEPARTGVASAPPIGVPAPPASPPAAATPPVAPPAPAATPGAPSSPTGPATAAAPNARIRRAPPTASSAAPLGRQWSGAFAGRSATLELEGSDATLTGRWTVRFGENVVVSRVQGGWNAGVLTLEDVEDGPDAGKYTGRVTADGTLDGRFEASSTGRTVAFRLRAPAGP